MSSIASPILLVKLCTSSFAICSFHACFMRAPAPAFSGGCRSLIVCVLSLFSDVIAECQTLCTWRVDRTEPKKSIRYGQAKVQNEASTRLERSQMKEFSATHNSQNVTTSAAVLTPPPLRLRPRKAKAKHDTSKTQNKAILHFPEQSSLPAHVAFSYYPSFTSSFFSNRRCHVGIVQARRSQTTIFHLIFHSCGPPWARPHEKFEKRQLS